MGRQYKIGSPIVSPADDGGGGRRPSGRSAALAHREGTPTGATAGVTRGLMSSRAGMAGVTYLELVGLQFSSSPPAAAWRPVTDRFLTAGDRPSQPPSGSASRNGRSPGALGSRVHVTRSCRAHHVQEVCPDDLAVCARPNGRLPERSGQGVARVAGLRRGHGQPPGAAAFDRADIAVSGPRSRATAASGRRRDFPCR